MIIPNPHPYGSPAWRAIEARNRTAEEIEGIVGVVDKRHYTDQYRYTVKLRAGTGKTARKRAKAKGAA